MPQKIDDFTIVLSEWTDIAKCALKVYEAAGWQPKDGATAVTPPIASQVEPRLILNVQDAKAKPEPLSTPSPD